jgi:hypothetical protein
MTCIWEYWGVQFWKHLYIYQEKLNVQNKKNPNSNSPKWMSNYNLCSIRFLYVAYRFKAYIHFKRFGYTSKYSKGTSLPIHGIWVFKRINITSRMVGLLFPTCLTHKYETMTIKKWETTNNKPPWPIKSMKMN